MSVMGINFTKMLVTKEKNVRGKINISNNIAITAVDKLKFDLGGKDQQSMKFNFSYISKYEPEVGTIELFGEVIYLAKKEEADKIVEEFNKTKKVSGETKLIVLNSIVSKCTIQALILSKDMNLPAPIPLPKVQSSSSVVKTEESVEKKPVKKTTKKE